MEAVGQLAGGVAHDLNNALGAVLGWASLLAEDPEPQDDDIAESIKTFNESVDFAMQVGDFASSGWLVSIRATLRNCESPGCRVDLTGRLITGKVLSPWDSSPSAAKIDPPAFR